MNLTGIFVTWIRRYVKIPNEVNPNVKIPNRDWRKNLERKNPELGENIGNLS
jgi:hypothetical protein